MIVLNFEANPVSELHMVKYYIRETFDKYKPA